jgi:hypothetical protein
MERFQTHGDLSWCELMTPDPAAARAFYAALLGWDMEEMSPAGMPYTVVKTAGQGVGGITAMPPGTAGHPPAWGVYITVDDVDARASRAVELGARILVPPTDIPGVGRFCWIQDPAGASLGLITYRSM